jgi:hypothetical protein
MNRKEWTEKTWLGKMKITNAFGCFPLLYPKRFSKLSLRNPFFSTKQKSNS